jgi:PAS domain S-box-containing protein
MDAPGFDALYGEAACGLLLTSPDGTIRRANATFCSWVGFAADELVDIRRVQDMLTIGGRVFHQTHLAPLMQMQGSVSEVKLDIVHRDGRSIPVLANVIRRRHGEQLYDEVAIMVATDRQKYERELLLARRSAESANERLAQDDRRKDEFLATLAHELRGPLAPMSNVLGVLRHKDIADPQIRWSREVLERQLAQITRLVEDLLEVARITEGKLRLQLAPVMLSEAMERAVEAAMPLIRSAQQELTLSLGPEPLWLNADVARLTQAILNLLVNASKFTPAGGSIHVSARRDGGMASCAIRDSGIGIDEQHLATVFEMFAQAEPALERTTGGLGIGLALVRGLVELHGGTVTAFSAGRGAGSEFVVRMPLAQPPAGQILASPDAVAIARRRILVVDDNMDSAESMAMILALEGHDTRTVHDGQSALEAVARGDAEVVLLDLGLPGLNGFEVARRLRATTAGRDLLLIATTGWGQQKDIQASAAAGFDHHLVKPVNFAALSAILSRKPVQD